MTTYNDVTGDPLRTKANSETYRNNYDTIFGKKEKVEQPTPSKSEEVDTARE